MRPNVLIAAGISACLLLAGCEVRTPGSFETKLMEGAKRRITVGGRSEANPLPPTPEKIHAGQQNFRSYCMVCHGLDGQNTGVSFAGKMSPPVLALNSRSVQAYTDGQLYRIIANGISSSGMPAAQGIFRDEEIWELVLYIRNLFPKGSLGEPQVYGGSGCATANCSH